MADVYDGDVLFWKKRKRKGEILSHGTIYGSN